MNKTTTWQQGQFFDKHQYRSMPDSWKADRRKAEALQVRPSPEGNAICIAKDPATAAWIAQRLNLAARLEQKEAKQNAGSIEPCIFWSDTTYECGNPRGCKCAPE
jgi:hypothetical protein